MGLRIPFGSANRTKAESSGWRMRGGGLLPGDPNPLRFEIVRLQPVWAYCAAEIRWPDAKNFEGRKIAVYRATPQQLQSATRLDPHFQEQPGPLVPIARFEPTALGWRLAIGVAFGLDRDEAAR